MNYNIFIFFKFMSWNINLLGEYKFNDNCISNIKIFQELLKKKNLYDLLEIKSLKKKKSDEHWIDTLNISKELLNYIEINKSDQYYFKILRIIRYCLFDKIMKSNLVIRSSNKELRYKYNNGENNIICAFVENKSLQSGVWVPKGKEYLLTNIIRVNKKKINKYYNNS